MFIPVMLLISCGSTFPTRDAYVADLTNLACVQYEIYDLEEIKFRRIRELPLAARGPCDRMMGFKRQDVTKVLNYIRKHTKKAVEHGTTNRTQNDPVPGREASE